MSEPLMRAVAKVREERGIALVEVPKPRITRPDDVLIEVAACGICGTDVQTYLWVGHAQGMRLPRVIGHELAGIVVETGRAAAGFSPGDRVVVESLGRCGECPACRVGAFNHCEQAERIGHTVDGAMARWLVAPVASLYRIPDSISFVHAALLKPLGVALRAFEQSGLLPGDTVAVLGPGAVGLLAGMIAKAGGASEVFVVGLREDEYRLGLSRKLGLTPIHADAAAEFIRARTDGRGVRLTIDASGGGTSLREAITITGRRGHVAVVGVSPPGDIDPTEIVMRELTIVGALTRLPQTWYRAIDLVASGVLDLEPLVSHVLPLEEAVSGFEALLAGSAMKVILQP